MNTASAAARMPMSPSRVIREARLRAPKGCSLGPPPTVDGPDAAPGARLFSVDGPWPRRHLVSEASAALIDRLATPARVRDRSITTTVLLRMVLDGLLEVELGDRFRSGAEAHRHLFPEHAPRRPASRVHVLSAAALQDAGTPVGHTAVEIADRLYRANTLPRSPSWVQRCGDDSEAAAFLTPQGIAAALPTSRSGPWRVWDRPQQGRQRHPPAAPIFKLYISTTPEAARDATAALLSTLTARRGPFSCKLGQDLASVLRPDRLVAYFHDRDSLRSTAARLRVMLNGFPAQGVPFSAPVGRDGLLSWGADLEHRLEFGSHARERSWRGWITSRLATAVVTAHRSGARNPVAFALDRVLLDGVQVSSWAPGARLLRQHELEAQDATA